MQHLQITRKIGRNPVFYAYSMRHPQMTLLSRCVPAALPRLSRAEKTRVWVYDLANFSFCCCDISTIDLFVQRWYLVVPPPLLPLPQDFDNLKDEAEFYQLGSLTDTLNSQRYANRIIEMVESTYWPYLLVHAPASILNHPDLPDAPSQSAWMAYGTDWYRERGYCKFEGMDGMDFRQFLQSIGCRYLDHSMSITVDAETPVRMESERWLSFFYD